MELPACSGGLCPSYFWSIQLKYCPEAQVRAQEEINASGMMFRWRDGKNTSAQAPRDTFPSDCLNSHFCIRASRASIDMDYRPGPQRDIVQVPCLTKRHSCISLTSSSDQISVSSPTLISAHSFCWWALILLSPCLFCYHFSKTDPFPILSCV